MQARDSSETLITSQNRVIFMANSVKTTKFLYSKILEQVIYSMCEFRPWKGKYCED
jgi:hypothetical protein